jgi:hypothetical protein
MLTKVITTAAGVLPDNVGMMKISRLVLGMAIVGAGLFNPGTDGGIVSAQAPNACALLATSDIQPLAPNETVADGIPNAQPAIGAVSCRYTSGVGVKRLIVNVTVTESSRMYPGLSPDQIKQKLVESVKAGTADAVIADVGQGAVFKAESPYHSTATASVKGRILEVQVDGAVAREKKDQVISLLKAAAGKL